MYTSCRQAKVEHAPQSYGPKRWSSRPFYGSSVADDLGVHQQQRLVELLTSKECEDLLWALSHQEEDIFQRVERLSAGTNPLDPRGPKPRAKREASTAAGHDTLIIYNKFLNCGQDAQPEGPRVLCLADDEARCRAALTDWMLRHGEQTYYDRLSRALQHVGRTDVAVEVGKNINQDKALKIKRYVEDYHKYVNSLNIPQERPDSDGQQPDAHAVRKRRVRPLTFRDLDLIVQRRPVPVYQKGPSDVAVPLMWGMLLGFGGTLVLGTSVVLATVHISRFYGSCLP
ncbi:transmembrane and death domain protein 1 [Spinachia spinachia]